MKNSLFFIFIVGIFLMLGTIVTPLSHDPNTGYANNVLVKIYLLGFSELLTIGSAIWLIILNFKTK